jgi:hypothetical protein
MCELLNINANGYSCLYQNEGKKKYHSLPDYKQTNRQTSREILKLGKED